ncbi:TylF/MycF/NovP-related O-methyltransferase [Candidatus Auribacterota bacterium]
MKNFISSKILEWYKIFMLQSEMCKLIPDSSHRMTVIKRMATISRNVQCTHNESEPLPFIVGLLSLPRDLDGCIVEAGAYKGGSLAKFSIISKLLNRKIYEFDSFEGLPDNKEDHDKSILGHSIKDWFKKEEFCGALDEVKNNVEKYGEIKVCEFIEGWYKDTMPGFSKKIVAAYLDVDLAESTKVCLKYLYPLIVPGGILYSQDGDFPLVIDVFNDDRFWETEVGCKKPKIDGLGKSKLLKIVKPV